MLDLEQPRGKALRCPFPDNHSRGDRSRSASVFVGKDGVERFKCHACQEKGDVINLAARVLRLSTKDAMAWLAGRGNVVPASPLPAPRKPSLYKEVQEERDNSLPRPPAFLHGMYDYLLNERYHLIARHEADNVALDVQLRELKAWRRWALGLIQARIKTPARNFLRPPR